jgi:hypothetical protein
LRRESWPAGEGKLEVRTVTRYFPALIKRVYNVLTFSGPVDIRAHIHTTDIPLIDTSARSACFHKSLWDWIGLGATEKDRKGGGDKNRGEMHIEKV